MKLMVESLVVFALSLSAAALIAQGEPAFAEIAVVDAAASPAAAIPELPSLDALVSTSLLPVGDAGKSSTSWLSP